MTDTTDTDAPYCWDCIGGSDENALAAPDDSTDWEACWGCGVHVFNGRGQRLCGRGDRTMDTWEPCKACHALNRQQRTAN